MWEPRVQAEALEGQVARLADPARAASEQAYLKLPDLRFHGVSVPATRRIARAWLTRRPGIRRDQLRSLVDALWSEPVFERRRLATELLVARAALLGAQDLPWLEGLVRTAGTWALVDELAARVAGPILEREPDAAGAVLDRWAVDDDFWLRRTALLALLGPMRAGEGDWVRFTRTADPMLDDPEFFIRKAIGWVLREACKQSPERVVGWVEARASRLSGLSFREAVRNLPEPTRRRLEALR